MNRTNLTFISIESDENWLSENRGKNCVFLSQWRGRSEREGAEEEDLGAEKAAEEAAAGAAEEGEAGGVLVGVEEASLSRERLWFYNIGNGSIVQLMV